MARLNDQLQNIRNLRGACDQLDLTNYTATLQLQKAKAALNQALRKPGGARDVVKLQQAVTAQQTAYDNSKSQLQGARANLQQAIGVLYQPGPQQLIDQLDDSIPFVLLPVRLETRFQTGGQSPELWVRVYPDDIAIHTHEDVLTDAEVAAGEGYWTALFAAIKTGGSAAEEQKKAAWSSLVAQFGAPRSAWVAQQTKPTNWSDTLAGLTDVSQLVFPPISLTKTQAWSRAPRSKVMPDKLVVMAFNGTTKVKEVTGNLVPSELIVGPDPTDTGSFVSTGNQLQFGPDFDWASNFDRAVALGLGFRIPLTAAEAVAGFDTIVVLGLCASGNQTDSQLLLQELFDNHHYSPSGFGLLSQGTATNNTDGQSSGYSGSDPFNQLSYYIETGPPLFTAADDCDGRNLADALGIDYATLQYVGGSAGVDYREAIDMNQALYAGTLGYFAGTLMDPVLSSENQDYLRDFFCRHVTGRGPLPALRVGKQPYGVLLTSNFSAWNEQERQGVYPSPFMTTLYKVLADYQAVWIGLLGQLSHTGMSGQDPDQVLTNILGLQPGAASFFQRNAYSAEYLMNLASFQFDGKYWPDAKAEFNSKNDGLLWLESLGYAANNTDGSPTVPELLRLIYQHYNTALDATNLVDNVPLSEANGIRYYDSVAKKNYLDWLGAAGSVGQLNLQDFGAGVAPPTALLYLMLRRALLLELSSASVRWFGTMGLDFSSVMAPTAAYNIRPEGTLTKWEVMKATVATAVPGSPQKNLAVGDYLLGPGSSESVAAWLGAMRAAVQELAAKPTARLERCFTEHLDTLTFRLDSWQTAMFHVRLQTLRNVSRVYGTTAPTNAVIRPNVTNGSQQPAQGLYLGAYGWVEDVRPAARQVVAQGTVPAALQPAGNGPIYAYANNGGFVHAPSINHASAAAVLRSGYLSHATADNPGTMSVNLSSERVRRALAIIEGIRGGQPVEALLGYQFESGVHDRASADNTLLKLNDYIFQLRLAFPIQQSLVQQQGGSPQQTIPATDVVNGLTLSASTLAFPYGATGAITGGSTDEQAALAAEKDKLADTLDAVNDLLTAESVYQLVLGNFDRAGATLNAMKDATVPPELDVVDTPRTSHFHLTNRVTIQVANGDSTDSATNDWPSVPMTPRAIMETGLNKWLQSLLGDVAQLYVRVSQLDADGNNTATLDLPVASLNLQAIDLVYLTGTTQATGAAQSGKENRTGASELESRIDFAYRQRAGIDDSAALHIEFLQPQGETGKKPLGERLALFRTLRSLITGSRYLGADDFNPSPQATPSDSNNPKGFDAAALLGRITQAQAAFQQALDAVTAVAINASMTEGAVTTVFSNLKDLFEALENDKFDVANIQADLADADASILQTALIGLANQGWGDAFPKVSATASPAAKLALLKQAQGIVRRMQTSLDQSKAQLPVAAALTDITKRVGTLVEAGQSLLGADFTILPIFNYNNEADILASDADRSQLLAFATTTRGIPFPAEEWMQQASHVRPRLARWDYIRMLCEASGNVSPLHPVQVPYRAKDSWLAVEYPATDPQDPTKPFMVTQDTLSIAIQGDQAFAPGEPHCGMLVDDWTENVPTGEEVTGIAFNYDQPNAFPPQAVLVAVTPAISGAWSWDKLTGILADTLLRAKLRAVDPDLLAKTGKVECNVLLPALLASFMQWDLDISLDYRLNLSMVAQKLSVSPVIESLHKD